MRELDLGGRNGQLRQDALSYLLAHAAFPEDDPSREQLLLLFHAERQRMIREGSAFTPSTVYKAVIHTVESQAARMALAGHVALVLTVLHAYGHEMSLKRASQIVSDFIYRGDGRLHWITHRDGQPVATSAKASGDPNDIAQHFRKYRAAAHILSAATCASEAVDGGFNFGVDAAPDFEVCFLKTVLEYEARLRHARNFGDWNLWSVARQLPSFIWDYPTLLPSDNFLVNLLGSEHAELVLGSKAPRTTH